jgi:hypothetical protein
VLVAAGAFASLLACPWPLLPNFGIALVLGVLLIVGVASAFRNWLNMVQPATAEPRPEHSGDRTMLEAPSTEG